jgi:hypothetical protein
MGTPQIIWLILNFVGIGVALSQHGQPRKGKHNFFATVIATFIEMLILYYGGFF